MSTALVIACFALGLSSGSWLGWGLGHLSSREETFKHRFCFIQAGLSFLALIAALALGWQA